MLLRRRMVGLALCLVLIGGVAADGHALTEKIQEHRLSNGMLLLTWEDHTIPIVTLFTFYKVGSRNEWIGRTGMAHLFEHMMFNGSKNYPPGEFDRLLESAGGSSNAYTTPDYTAYFESFPPEAIDLVLDLEADRMAGLDISDRMLESESGVVREERRYRTDNSPVGKLEEQLLPTAFMAHPYQWPVIGWMTDLHNITVDDCWNFYKMYYAPNNATMIAVGDFDTAELVAKIRAKIEPIPSGPAIPTVLRNEPEQLGPRRTDVAFDAQTPHLMVGYHIPAVESEDVAVLEVIQQLLTGGESSRLTEGYVYGSQIAVDTWIDAPVALDPPLFYVYMEMREGHTAAEGETAILHELDRLKADTVGTRELTKVRNNLAADFLRQQRTQNGRANLIGWAQTVLGDYRRLDEVVARYRAVTAQDIQRVASAYFDPGKRTVAAIVPSGGDDRN